MTFATLVLRRESSSSSISMVRISMGGSEQELDYSQAEEYFERVYIRPWETYGGNRPDFKRWLAANGKVETETEIKIEWQAEFLTSTESERVDLGGEGESWEYPTPAALRELDRLEREGWKLVHVSEDHCAKGGEAYLARVRYLLSRTQIGP